MQTFVEEHCSRALCFIIYHSCLYLICLQDPKTAFALLPFKRLPKFLYPTRDRVLNPPVFDFGYVYTYDCAFEFARDHGLGDTEDYDCDEAVFDAVMEYITREAGITSFKLRAEDLHEEISDLPRFPLLVSITSNYRRVGQLDGPVDQDDVSKLQKFLERTDSPKWYLDMHYPGWRKRPWDSCL